MELIVPLSYRDDTYAREKRLSEKKNIKMFSLCLHIHTTHSYHETTWILVIILDEIILMFLLVFCFRYELLRCKIQQPLASNPPEDLNMWHNIYSGTQRFYEDKGLSRWDYKNYKNKCWHLVWGMLNSLENVSVFIVWARYQLCNKTCWLLSVALIIELQQSACLIFATLTALLK